MKSRVLLAQVRQRNAGRATKPGSEVHPGARARGQEGDQDKDGVYEDSQSHAEHYPEKAPARGTSPPSPAEHDYEEVYDPQTRRHPEPFLIPAPISPRVPPRKCQRPVLSSCKPGNARRIRRT